MRRLGLFIIVCAVLGFASFAVAQSPGGRGGCQRGGGGPSGSSLARSFRSGIIASGGTSSTAGSGIFDGSNLRPELLVRFDYDGDGKLNAEERARLTVELRRRGLPERLTAQLLARLALLEQYDTNGDFRLSAGEQQAAREAAAAKAALASSVKKRPATRKQAEILAKYDANGDGKLGAAEKAKMRQDQNAASKATRD